jgi:hypothetical protein
MTVNHGVLGSSPREGAKSHRKVAFLFLVYTNKINEYANIVVIYKFEKKGNIYVIGFWRPIDGGHARIEYSYRKKKLSILAHECGAI